MRRAAATLLLFVVCACASKTRTNTIPTAPPGGALVAFRRHVVAVELALNEEQQAKGLMGRKSLGPNAGMFFLFPAPQSTAFYMYKTLIPLSIAVAILRYHLYDIDLLINRGLVYGTLTACVVGLYVLVVGYLGALFHTGGNLAISLVATGCVAMVFQPLRESNSRMRSSRRAVAASRCADSSAISSPSRSSSPTGSRVAQRAVFIGDSPLL